MCEEYAILNDRRSCHGAHGMGEKKRSSRSLEPVVNHAKVYYVLAVIDEELFDSVVVLKLDPTDAYQDQAHRANWDVVCGPEGEVCACYHNGQELLSGEVIIAYDGDFISCWLDAEPPVPTRLATRSYDGSDAVV